MNREQFNDLIDGLGYDPSNLDSGGVEGVNSSNLHGVGYDFGSRTLTVVFTSGNAYQYDSVPPSVVVELLSAGSHGSFFHHNIRLSYPYTRL